MVVALVMGDGSDGGCGGYRVERVMKALRVMVAMVTGVPRMVVAIGKKEMESDVGLREMGDYLNDDVKDRGIHRRDPYQRNSQQLKKELTCCDGYMV